MREIKFRIWDQTKSNFVDNPTRYQRLAIGCDGGVYSGNYDDIIEDRYVIEQYTGLKDKNDKEVYEGDIVEFSRWNSPNEALEDYLCTAQKKIVWGLNYGQFPNAGWSAISLRPADLEEGHALKWMDARNMIVVGNIHENPELLKQ